MSFALRSPQSLSLELEMSIIFPTCWDGVNLESQDGQQHVVFAENCKETNDPNADIECFNLNCPASHPIKMPEIHFYVRILGYEGGAHVFADGTDVSNLKTKLHLIHVSKDKLSFHHRFCTATISRDGTKVCSSTYWTTVKMNLIRLHRTLSAATFSPSAESPRRRESKMTRF